MLTRIRFLSMSVFCLLLVCGCIHRHPVTDPSPHTTPAPASSAPGGSSSDHEALLPEPVFHGLVRIEEAGTQNSETVILVHGAGDHAALDWEKTIPVLAGRYHVIAFDLPGFGRSSKSNEFYSPERYAELLQWIADRFTTGRFVLIGHSLGGAVALHYAADHADRLSRLILVDAAGILNRVSLAKTLFLTNDETDSLRGKQGFEEFLRFMLDRVMNDERAKKLEDSLQDASFRERVLGGDPKKISAVALALDDFGPVVEQVRTPTLLIWGTRDRIAPLRTARALAARLNPSRLVLIPEAGHVPMIDQPETFNKIVMDELGATKQPETLDDKDRPDKGQDARVVRYDHQRGITLTGQFSEIELDYCTDVTIRDATAGRIVARHSDVVIENTGINGSGQGLIARRSEIFATGLTIHAETAIQADKSHLDLAGVSLFGSRAAVSTSSNSVLLFSISRIDSPSYSGPMHGSWKITKKNSL